MRKRFQQHVAKLVVVTVAVALYLLAAPRVLQPSELKALANRFKFEPTYIEPAANGVAFRRVRDVHPDLKHIDAWISSVGASVAIADIAGLGRPADMCLVDPRNDSVTVMPAPRTETSAGPRFAKFTLTIPTDGYAPHTIAPMGCLAGDVNEDGKVDLIVYFWGRTPVVFLQVGEGELTAARFKPVEIVSARERWNTNAAVFADVDGDGHPDLVFGNYFRDGDRILDPNAAEPVEMQHSMSRAANAGRLKLLVWDKRTTADHVVFVDRSDVFEAVAPHQWMTGSVAAGWTLALGVADLTGDLLPEIYVANDFGPDRLLLNKSTPGHPAFELVEGERGLFVPRSKVLGRDSFKGMGVDFGDVTGDGRLAIAVSNIAEEYALLESHFLYVHTGEDAAWGRGVAPYRDESGPRGTWIGGWGWDLKFADLDNSGRAQILQTTGFLKGERNRWPELQELAMGNDELLKYPFAWPRFGIADDLSGHGSRERLFVPDASGRYHDVWPLLEIDSNTVSRGIATGDVYGDGRLAVAIARQWMPSLFLRNVTAQENHWIVLDLRLPGRNGGERAAIGATARLVRSDGRIISGWVDGGSGHSGRRAAEIHLGLGKDLSGPDVLIEIAWRDGAAVHRRTLRLAADRRHRILLTEGALAQFAASAAGGTQ